MPEQSSAIEKWIMRGVAVVALSVLGYSPKIYMVVEGYDELKAWKNEQVAKEGDEKLLRYRLDEMDKKLDRLLNKLESNP